MGSSELRGRLAARASLAGVTVSPHEIDQIEIYYRLLERWNRTINLTAFRLDIAVDETLDRLLIEPLAAAASIPALSGRWIDLGSGGGSPAIPMRIARPQLTLTMVESRERKAAFLREATRKLALSAVEVLTERIEILPAQRPDLAGLYSLVTVRAVRIESGLLKACRWLLMSGGRLLLFGAQSDVDTTDTGFGRATLVDLRVGERSTLLILET